jgi:hypothetical protein
VLSKLDPSFIHDSDKLMLIEELIGTSKLAFIDNTGDITLLGNFIEDDGYIYSNQSYKPKEKPKYSLNSNRGYYSSSLFGQLEETDEEMDEKSLKRLDDYFSLTDLDGFQGEMGDFVY